MSARSTAGRLALVVAALAAAGASTAAVTGQGVDAPPAPTALAAGDATVWYLGHCGFAVRTARHLLIFDYQERRDGPQPRTRGGAIGLDTGWVDPAAIARDKVRVFVSHSHEDHFDPVIFGWRKAVPDIAY